MTNEEYFEQMFPSLVNAEAFTIGNRRFVSMDKVLKIIDCVEHTEGLSKADEYGLLRMKISELKGGEQE